eukprot:5241269-Heterocapsa_arctica.AAC.1
MAAPTFDFVYGCRHTLLYDIMTTMSEDIATDELALKRMATRVGLLFAASFGCYCVSKPTFHNAYSCRTASRAPRTCVHMRPRR